MNKRLLVLCNLNCVSSHLGCMGSGKLYEQLCASSTCEQYSLGSTQGNSQLAAVASSLTCLSSCSKANPQKRWIARIPRGQKYISFNQERKTERQRALEQIHIVSSHRELGDRKKVSFHGKFPDYYSSSPISAIPTSTPLVSHGRKMNDTFEAYFWNI